MAPGGSFFASWPCRLEAGRGRDEGGPSPGEAFPPLSQTPRTADGEEREEQVGREGGSPDKLDGARPPSLPYPQPWDVHKWLHQEQPRGFGRSALAPGLESCVGRPIFNMT